MPFTAHKFRALVASLVAFFSIMAASVGHAETGLQDQKLAGYWQSEDGNTVLHIVTKDDGVQDYVHSTATPTCLAKWSPHCRIPIRQSPASKHRV